jgi:hypothetical protein
MLAIARVEKTHDVQHGSLMSQSTNCHALAANGLLPTLPLEEVDHLFPSLEPVTFELGKVICEPREQLNSVYFLTTSVVSFLYMMADGTTAERLQQPFEPKRSQQEYSGPTPHARV